MSLLVGIILVIAASTIGALSLSRKARRRQSGHEITMKNEPLSESSNDSQNAPIEINVDDSDNTEDHVPHILEEYNDNKQDLLDFAAAMSESAVYKNRYSALQNTSFVVQRITEEYETLGKDEDFYDFVLAFCEKMKFQNGDDSYRVAEDIASKLKTQKRNTNGKPHIHKAETQRPSAESFYPLAYTGDGEVDEFIDIAKELLHKKIRHLKSSEEENEEELDRVVRAYRPRTGVSFYDFFTNQFQFSYLTERRFQDLYYMLFQIALAKKDGLSKEQVLQRVNSIYRLDETEQPLVRERKKSTREKKPKQASEKVVPFNAYTELQHKIIAVASRISRTYNENKIFRRTGQLAIALVNKFLEVKENAISERTFYTINLSGLQKEDKKNGTVYAILIDVVNFVFQGMSEDDVFRRVSLDKRMPPLEQSITEYKDSRRSNERKKVHSSACSTGIKALIKTIKECGMLTKTQECINLAVYLDSTLNSLIQLSLVDYYKALKSVIEVKQLTSFNSRLLSYILECKINDVPDVSMRSLVESRFPAAYRIKKAKKR